jgi:hypothetical protein
MAETTSRVMLQSGNPFETHVLASPQLPSDDDMDEDLVMASPSRLFEGSFTENGTFDPSILWNR